ncbi:PA2779 family protein [Pseudomonas sp. sp1636]|uniref:PA2779 family protein n=1 Tax=Pseudomonas sp. sp1636 TaxID=3036707 RepID=UPI0025A5FDA7|nr:PA2779 family protein [Pseudomonas sp. sp1636]MDM8349945.1 PA2779 family protein [Pseudomonas sp. sp1636]
MYSRSLFRRMAAMLAVFHVLMIVQIPQANARMIGTGEVLAEQQQQVDRQQLLSMLDEQGVQEKLLDMGVDRTQVEDRINSLTSAELAQFNQQLAQAPAGASGVVGIIVLFLVIFIVTDLLCATNIFNFVKCINR